MNRLLVILLSIGCEDPGTCLEAPELPRAACDHATIAVVIHVPPDLDDVRLEQQVEEAAELLRPHHIDLELAGHVVESYSPYLDATTCDAFDNWGDRISHADSGTIHIWAMREIRRGDLYFEGVAQPEHKAVALLPNAQDGIAAHEIGHVLGLMHSERPGDVMVAGDIEPGATFTPDQGATMLAHACAF